MLHLITDLPKTDITTTTGQWKEMSILIPAVLDIKKDGRKDMNCIEHTDECVICQSENAIDLFFYNLSVFCAVGK